MPSSRRIRINDRDVATLATLGEYGVLDAELCHTLCFAGFTPEWCRQNLVRLAAVGLIGTTTLRIWFERDGSRGGRNPKLFFLTKAGAEVVAVRGGTYPRRVLRSEPSPATFWHRLQVVRFRVAFDQAASEMGLTPLRWIMEQDSRPDAPKKLMPQHRRMLHHEHRDGNGKLVTCRPDAAAVLQVPHPSGDSDKAADLAIHFEIDRSTEGVAQCVAKLPGYAALIAERSHLVRYWSDLRNPVYRIFWLVPSRERIETLRAAFRSSPVAACCRFAAAADCVPGRVLTEKVWHACDPAMPPMEILRGAVLPVAAVAARSQAPS